MDLFLPVWNLVQRIKTAATYNQVVGKDLGIIGTVSVDTHFIPEFTVITERGMVGERVKLMFTKYSHDGVIVESRRGDGDWEFLGVVVTKPGTMNVICWWLTCQKYASIACAGGIKALPMVSTRRYSE